MIKTHTSLVALTAATVWSTGPGCLVGNVSQVAATVDSVQPLQVVVPENANVAPEVTAPAPEVVWPHTSTAANSDPYLVAHHAEFTRLEPRLMVMNFENGRSEADVRGFAQKLMDALAEGSRFHAYKDANAPVFLRYQLARIANLVDAVVPPGCPNLGTERRDCSSQATPRRGAAGARQWDYAHMFTQAFADLVGWQDPTDPSHNMTLCEIFERGFVHEVWLNDPTSDGGIAEILARAPVYDAQRAPTGAFTLCAGNGCFASEADGGGCKVTVRLANIAFDRGPGCGTHSFGHAMEHMGAYIPYLAPNMARFFNFDLDKRLGADLASFYQTPYYKLNDTCAPLGHPIIQYASATDVTATWTDAEHPCGRQSRLSGIWDGCGNVHFSPNATEHYDYERDDAGDANGRRIPVANTCENFAEGGGDNGGDPRTLFTYTKAAGGDQMGFGDCGGGWQIYLRQSMPGLGNRATGADGRPMLNWWPFLFY